MATKVVIIGGGFGGISVAKQLSSSQFDVTLIDRTNHHLFQPLLYQVATAALSPGDIAIPIRAIFSKRDNLNVVLGEVVDINKEENTVALKDGESIPFDYLILAPGSQYNYFGNNDWEEHAPGLKSLRDALQIRERILLSLEQAERLTERDQRAPYLTYVIIGGGPTGVETAGSIAEIAKRNMMRDFKNIKKDETHIVLVEAAQNVLNGYPEELSEVAKSDLENMGVDVVLNTPVKEITEKGVQLENRFIETPNVIWAAGTAASPLLQCLDEDIDKAGRVKVQPDLSINSNPNIFVIGDAAYFEDKDGKPLPGVAPVALQQGKYVGELIIKEQKGGSRSNFSYLDKGMMATIGRAKAIANIRGIKVSGFIAWLMWGFIHIFFLIGFRNRFRVFAEWIWHYLTFKRGVRLITKRENKD